MAASYVYCGGICWWDYSSSSANGRLLPVNTGGSPVAIPSPTVEPGCVSDYFLDMTSPTNLRWTVQYEWYHPTILATDIGKFNMVVLMYRGASLLTTIGGPTFTQTTAQWKSTATTFDPSTVVYPTLGNLRFVPSYYDIRTSGAQAKLRSIRLSYSKAI